MSAYRTSVIASDFHPDTIQFFRNKKVIVTGSSGLVGSHLIEQLLQIQAKPIALSRQPDPKFLSHLNSSIEIRQCDLFSYESTLNAFKNADLVINLAANVVGLGYNSLHPASIYHDNTLLFLNVIKATVDSGIEYLSSCSSACIYPRDCKMPTPEIEGTRGEPEPTSSGYGWAKRMQEYLSIKAAEEYGLKVAIPRPYNCYGPRDRFDPKTSHVIPALVYKALHSPNGQFEVWGKGDHSRSFLYVDDFARGVLEVTARYHCADPINIGENEEVTILDVANKISEYIKLITGKTVSPVFNSNGLTGQPRRKCDTSKLVEKLGFKTLISFDEGLKKTIEWYCHEYL